MSSVGFINPYLVTHDNDVHSSGIPYMPHILAYAVANFKKKNIPHFVLDIFGADPFSLFAKTGYSLQGLAPAKVAELLEGENPEVLVYYASSVFNGEGLFEAIRIGQKALPAAKTIVIENTQAVTGYSLQLVLGQFAAAGVDFVVLGEPEEILPSLIGDLLDGGSPQELAQKYKSLWSREAPKENLVPEKIADLEQLPFPAWEDFPLASYWKLKVAHAPFSGPYLALLSSRGCPFPCNFCSIPVMNQRKWRPRSVASVLAELAHFEKSLGITEFHFEDVNPTVQESRILALCEALKALSTRYTFKVASGTKLDRFKVSTITAMVNAGFKYLSISPESGSKKVLLAIGKPFEYENGLALVKEFASRGGYLQACVVIGHPAEEEADLLLTEKYVTALAKAGAGEIAVFMICPMPGTAVSQQLQMPAALSDLTFTPTWRQDYKNLEKWRRRLYTKFFLAKAKHHPASFLKSMGKIALPFLSYDLKMEMLPRRTFVTKKGLLRKSLFP